MIDAVGKLIDKGLDVRFLIGGSGPARAQLEQQVASQGMSKRIDFLGFVCEDDIRRLYEDMDLFVSIDWADFQITTFEVLAANRKVLISEDTDVDEELLRSGYLYVAPANAGRLAEVIERALATPVRWDRNRLKRYLARFSWEAYFANIEHAVSHSG